MKVAYRSNQEEHPTVESSNSLINMLKLLTNLLKPLVDFLSQLLVSQLLQCMVLAASQRVPK